MSAVSLGISFLLKHICYIGYIVADAFLFMVRVVVVMFDFHNKIIHFNIYLPHVSTGALLMSNYGLWNVYVFASTLLYSKFKSNMKLTDKSSH